MTRYLVRLDDASPFCNSMKWNRIAELLERYGIAPIIGIIPNNQDPLLLKNPYDDTFWHRARKWQEMGWCIALHGYNHVYGSRCGGMNPVNQESEFAGLRLDVQEEKIEKGIAILREQGLIPRVFIAPSHTFDENTLQALKNKSDIRIISDTIANDIYFKRGFYFIPQQSGSVRRLPLKTVTFCYHPDEVNEKAFTKLEQFIKENQHKFVGFADLQLAKRHRTPFDSILSFVYFNLRRLVQ